MKHTTSVLEFQKRLIRSSMMVPRMEAMNLLGIVYSNLEEFIENRLARSEEPELIMDSMLEVYETWADAVYRKFPNLCQTNVAYDIDNLGSNENDILELIKKFQACAVSTDAGFMHGMPARYYHLYARWEDDCFKLPTNIHTIDGHYVMANPRQILAAPSKPMSNSDVSKKLTKALTSTSTPGAFFIKFTSVDSLVSKANSTDDAPLVQIEAVHEFPDEELGAPHEPLRFIIAFKYPIMVRFNEVSKMILKHYRTAHGDINCDSLAFKESEKIDIYPLAYGPAKMLVTDDMLYTKEDSLIVRLPAFMRKQGDKETDIIPLTAPDLVKAFSLQAVGSKKGGCAVSAYDNQFMSNLKESWFTIYRCDSIETGKNTNFIIQCALALRHKCHVYIEARARGEEASNLALYQKLKKIGADVNLIPHHEKAFNKKVHAKIWLFKQKPGAGGNIVLCSTGNFSESAQMNYRDTLFIQRVTDGSIFKNYVALFDTIIDGKKYDWADGVDDNFVWQPKAINQRIRDEINRKITDAKTDDTIEYDGLPEHFIWIKANHILDDDMIRLITEAANTDNLQIRIIVRTACGLPLRYPFNDYEVHSVCGKLLEHDRFYIFGHYEKNDAGEQVPCVDDAFISSADLMKRNLFERVEFLHKMPEEHAEQIAELFDNMFSDGNSAMEGYFNYRLSSTGNSWVMVDEEDS